MNPSPPVLHIDNQLCFALYSSSLAMTKAYKPLLAKLGITYPQYLVLLVLWQHGAQRVGELGEKLFLDSGTLTPLTKRMETQGLLKRRRSEQDERQVELTLTEAGAKLREQAELIPACVLQLSSCELPQIQRLTEELKLLREQLNASAERAADVIEAARTAHLNQAQPTL